MHLEDVLKKYVEHISGVVLMGGTYVWTENDGRLVERRDGPNG